MNQSNADALKKNELLSPPHSFHSKRPIFITKKKFVFNPF